MTDLLDDQLNLEILEAICSGDGVNVNVSSFSKTFKKHRNTIKSQVINLFKHRIINKPFYPFMWLYEEYPLMVVAQADLPRNEKMEAFFRADENIFAGFYVRDQEYNTLLIEYHKDLYEYGRWRKRIVSEKKIPPRETRYPASSLYFSTQQIIKYMPESPIYIMEKKLKKDEDYEINGFELNDLSFNIMKQLMEGKGIRTNENYLSEKLGVHRKTVEKRISAMIAKKIIMKPVCRFPHFFVPPNKILCFSLLEIKRSKEKIIRAVGKDHHIPIAYEANVGRYNMMLFGVFFNVEEHFEWLENYDKRFSGCIGAMKNIYLSPKMTTTIDQQKVSLNIIKEKMQTLHGKELRKALD